MGAHGVLGLLTTPVAQATHQRAVVQRAISVVKQGQRAGGAHWTGQDRAYCVQPLGCRHELRHLHLWGADFRGYDAQLVSRLNGALVRRGIRNHALHPDAHTRCGRARIRHVPQGQNLHTTTLATSRSTDVHFGACPRSAQQRKRIIATRATKARRGRNQAERSVDLFRG